MLWLFFLSIPYRFAGEFLLSVQNLRFGLKRYFYFSKEEKSSLETIAAGWPTSFITEVPFILWGIYVSYCDVGFSFLPLGAPRQPLPWFPSFSGVPDYCRLVWELYQPSLHCSLGNLLSWNGWDIRNHPSVPCSGFAMVIGDISVLLA